MKNIVYFELLRRGYRVTVGNYNGIQVKNLTDWLLETNEQEGVMNSLLHNAVHA